MGVEPDRLGEIQELDHVKRRCRPAAPAAYRSGLFLMIRSAASISLAMNAR